MSTNEPRVSEPKRTYNQTTNNQLSRKQPRKGENPVRLPSAAGLSQGNGSSSNTRICKNSACRAVLSSEDMFCKRCSCCICYLFDDNKDPSLWLVCSSEFNNRDSCGLSCHIECGLQRQKVGVVNMGQFMQLDGSYCCASCGNVSGILGCWKKQLIIAKDARRVDVLSYRISLSYRLLDGTSRFKELHEIVSEAKKKLETELGLVTGVSLKMARGLVSRLSVAADIQKLCSLAIQKTDTWLNNFSSAKANQRENSSPADCKFIIEEVMSSSLAIALTEPDSPSSDAIKGYKLWYYKTKEESPLKEPTLVFPKTQKRIKISNLQPFTEYTFKITPHTDSQDLAHSEATCFTLDSDLEASIDHNTENPLFESSSSTVKEDPKSKTENGSSDFKVEDPSTNEEPRFTNHKLDLNVVSVPDLNLEAGPHLDSSRDEDDAISHGLEKNIRNSNTRKAKHINNAYDCVSTLINGSSFETGDFDGSYEYCVKIIRWLECEGHIEKEFRMKFLTWFSLRSTEQQRRVVNTFVQTLMDDPSSLAGQLVDSFSDIIENKKHRNGFCSKLWH